MAKEQKPGSFKSAKIADAQMGRDAKNNGYVKSTDKINTKARKSSERAAQGKGKK
jgi:hypothetical protein